MIMPAGMMSRSPSQQASQQDLRRARGGRQQDPEPHGSSTAGLGLERSHTTLGNLLRQFRSTAPGADDTSPHPDSIEMNIVQTALSRLGTYQEFRAKSERAYRARTLHHIALTPKDQLHQKNEELVIEIAALKSRLSRRDATVWELRNRLSAAIAESMGEHGPLAAAPASATAMDLSSFSSSSSSSALQHDRNRDKERECTTTRAQSDELLALTDEIHTLRLTIDKQHAATLNLERRLERDAVKAREALYRSEQREVQLFDRMRALEKESVVLHSAIQVRENFTVKLQTQLETRSQELLDSETRCTELEAALQAALSDGEHLAVDLEAATRAVEAANEEREAAIEDTKRLMGKIHAENRDDLRDRYEALVKELDGLVAAGVFSGSKGGKISQQQKDDEDDHGIDFGAFSMTTPKRPVSPPGGHGHVVEMTRRALKGTGPSKGAKAMEDIGEDAEEEEEEGGGGPAGMFRRMQEMEDKLAQERVKTALLTKDNINLQATYKALLGLSTKDESATSKLKEKQTAREQEHLRARVQLQTEILKLQTEKRELLMRFDLASQNSMLTNKSHVKVGSQPTFSSQSALSQSAMPSYSQALLLQGPQSHIGSLTNLALEPGPQAQSDSQSQFALPAHLVPTEPHSFVISTSAAAATATSTITATASATAAPTAASTATAAAAADDDDDDVVEYSGGSEAVIEVERAPSGTSHQFAPANAATNMDQPHAPSHAATRAHDPSMTDEVDLDAGELGSDPSALHFGVEAAVQTDKDEGATHAEAQTDALDCELPREESIMRIFRALRVLTRQQLPTQADFLLPSATQFSPHAGEQMRHDLQSDVKALNALTTAEATWRLRRALLYVGAANAMRNRLVREIALVPAWQSSTSRMFVRCLDLVLQSAHILLNPAAAGPRPSECFAEVAKAVGMDEEEGEVGGWGCGDEDGEGKRESMERRASLRPSALPVVEALTGSPRGLIKVPAGRGVSFTSAPRALKKGVDGLLADLGQSQGQRYEGGGPEARPGGPVTERMDGADLADVGPDEGDMFADWPPVAQSTFQILDALKERERTSGESVSAALVWDSGQAAVEEEGFGPRGGEGLGGEKGMGVGEERREEEGGEIIERQGSEQQRGQEEEAEEDARGGGAEAKVAEYEAPESPDDQPEQQEDVRLRLALQALSSRPHTSVPTEPEIESDFRHRREAERNVYAVRQQQFDSYHQLIAAQMSAKKGPVDLYFGFGAEEEPESREARDAWAGTFGPSPHSPLTLAEFRSADEGYPRKTVDPVLYPTLTKGQGKGQGQPLSLLIASDHAAAKSPAPWRPVHPPPSSNSANAVLRAQREGGAKKREERERRLSWTLEGHGSPGGLRPSSPTSPSPSDSGAPRKVVVRQAGSTWALEKPLEVLDTRMLVPTVTKPSVGRK